MLCLRCGLEHPPEARFCRRCGRALSRPPGTAEPGNGHQEDATRRDSDSLYSTFSPPECDEIAQPQGARPGRAAGCPDDSDDVLAPGDKDALPLPLPFQPRQAAIGSGRGARHRLHTRQGQARIRRLIAALITCGVLLLLASAGLMRYRAYARDLQEARRQAAMGAYATAISRYQAAIAEWPFNTTATDELANLQAARAAVAEQQQTIAAVAGMRSGMFQAQSAQRQVVARQVDTYAEATATVVARATALAVAQASLPRWVNISPPRVSTDFNKPTNNYGFQAIAVDPLHPDTVFVGTCYQGLWKSTDDGHTWFKVNTGANGTLLDTGRLWSIAIDRFNPQTLYVAAGYGEQGVLKSTDGGVDWKQMLPATSDVAQRASRDVAYIATDPYRSGHILATFHSLWGSAPRQATAGILESFDDANTWITHQAPSDWAGGSEASHTISFLDNSSTWLVGRNDGLWRTTDGGATWTQVSSSGAVGGTYRASNGVWYAGALQNVLRSTNGGRSWTAVGPQAGTGYSTVIGDGNYLYIQVSPNYSRTPSHYYVSPESDGTTWATYNDQTFADGPASAAVDPVKHIVYTSNLLAGVWKLERAGQ